MPNVEAMGTRIGTITKRITRASMKHPSTKIIRLTAIRNISGLSAMARNTSAICCGACSRAKMKLKSDTPATIVAIEAAVAEVS